MGTASTFAIGEVPGTGFFPGASAELKVFKTGTFKDSLGRQKTWTAADLENMVKHFGTLTALGVKFPIRVDHSESAKDVIGWVASLRTDGTYLYATPNFTEPDAAAKYERGTYGPRSAEVGEYETNGAKPDTYFPVFMGVAFVDMPAVEGLYGSGQAAAFSQVLFEGDRQVKFKINGAEVEDAAAVQSHIDTQAPLAAKGATKFKIAGADSEDFAAVQAHIATLEGQVATFGQTGTFTFKVKGTDTTDAAAVQAHITNLETVLDESRTAHRASFVKGLSDAKKIAAPQVEALTELATSMTDEQYEKFKVSYEAAPVLSLFGNHAPGTTNPDGTQTEPGQPTEAEKEMATVREQVAMLRRTLKPEQLEKTSPFKRFKALEASAAGR